MAKTYEATAGRTATVVVGSDIFTYAYKTNAPHLVATVTKSGSPVLQTINTWEPNRDVLDWKENKTGSTSVSKYDYTVNAMGRRTNASQTGTAFAASNSWTWGYNTRGEIATADSSIAAYDRAYQTDEIGNLRKTSNIAEPSRVARGEMDGAQRSPQGEGRGGRVPNQYESGALTRAHTWGLDLSGSLQGAGGVGGLVASKIDGTTYYPTYDGNGNVSEYINGSGTVVAHYEYDAYGNIMNSLSGLAPSFNIRFSTKYMDRSTAFYYYGFRYYQPFIGLWINRDPVAELGFNRNTSSAMKDEIDEDGNNMYAFAANCLKCSCIYGAFANVIDRLCNGTLGFKKCTLLNALGGALAGCISGGAGLSDNKKLEVIAFIIGIDTPMLGRWRDNNE